MQKLIRCFLTFILISIVAFFSLNIFLKTYFNKRYYSVPNLVGITLEDTKKIDLIDKINIKVLDYDFSPLPKGTIFKQIPAPKKVVKQGRTISIWISKGKDEYVVPNFLYKNITDISAELQKNGIKIKHVTYTSSELPYNTIIATNPAPGEKTVTRKEISLLVSDSSKQAIIVRVPDAIGYTYEETSKNLTDKGLIIGEITEIKIPNLEKGIVVDMSNIGERVSVGTIINIVISK